MDCWSVDQLFCPFVDLFISIFRFIDLSVCWNFDLSYSYVRLSKYESVDFRSFDMCICFMSISESIYWSLSLSICLTVDLSFCTSVHLSIFPSIDLSISPSIAVYICRYVYLSTCPFTDPTCLFHKSICAPLCLSIFLSANLPYQYVNLLIFPFVDLSVY